jgi:hypothetical protein
MEKSSDAKFAIASVESEACCNTCLNRWTLPCLSVTWV